jgi:hypothetical protein
MSGDELTTLRSYTVELDYLGRKLEEKQDEIDRELDRIRLVQKAIEIVLDSNPELNFQDN